MEYTYETHLRGSNARIDVSTRFEDVENNYCEPDTYYIKIYDNHFPKESVEVLENLQDWQEWRDFLEKNAAWKPSKVFGKDPIETNASAGEPFELPEKGHTYFVEDDGFHELAMSMFKSSEDLRKESRIMLEMQETKQGLADAINPPHYQSFLDQYQWIETMCRLQRFKDNPEQFEAAIELQVRKYLDRCGRKDARLQELEKALWYLKFLVAYVKNGSVPIHVEDVEKILSGELGVL
jgi:hypothetical protein